MTFMFRPNRLPVYDDRSILGEIKRVIINYFHGACPTKKEFDKYSMVKSWAIRKRFGSWAQAVRRAGFEYKGRNYENLDLRREKYTRELMVADLERVKRLNAGRYFSQAYYIDNGGKYSVCRLSR